MGPGPLRWSDADAGALYDIALTGRAGGESMIRELAEADRLAAELGIRLSSEVD